MHDKKTHRFAARAAALVTAACLAASALGCGTRSSRGPSNGEPAGSTLGGTLGSRTPGSSTNGVVARYMAEQAEVLSTLGGAVVERLGREIRVTLSSAALFDFDSAMLKPASLDGVSQMADVLLKYPDTYVVVTGHTDSEGEEEYNQKLSERRAISVRNYLEEKGIESARLETIGYGELRPVASNGTEEGRRKNQRVEITIRPNESLWQRAAEEDK